ncbi:MAG TPA: HAD hydrolase-like protein [Longimicrobiaceae bacterium]|nr:HAD hydrolase-like protein [Longimicrobiaceae bacterium]
MKYRLVIFDFDGTLADSFPWFVRVVNSVADRYRFRRIEEGEIEVLRGYGARRLMRHLAVPAWKLPLIVRHMRILKSRDVREIPLFPGVNGLLRELAERGVELALVTSNSYENAVRILGPENAARFRYWECGASVFGKRARFRRVLRRSGVPRGEALCIGDEIRDLEAARAEGIPFGAVAWGYTRADALRAHAPAESFETVGDIVATVG